MVGEAREEDCDSPPPPAGVRGATGRAKTDGRRLIENGKFGLREGVQEGIKEQQRLLVGRPRSADATSEATRLIDSAHAGPTVCA